MPESGKVRQEAGGIVLLDGKVVLHRTKLGNLNFPKGKIEKGESAEQAAAREVLEETGLEAEVVEPLGALPLLHHPRPQVVQYFLMRATQAARAVTERLTPETELVDPGQVAERLSFKEYRRFWRQIEARVRAVLRTED